MAMRNELQQRLVDRWPSWFSIGGDPRYTSMHFGFQHGNGWFDLLWRLCERLEPVVAAEKESHTEGDDEELRMTLAVAFASSATSKFRLLDADKLATTLLPARTRSQLVEKERNREAFARGLRLNGIACKVGWLKLIPHAGCV
jgi:hypothetical protein